MYVLFSIFLIVVFCSFYYVLSKKNIALSSPDALYHKFLIKAILKNNNRFVKTHYNVFNENVVAYPQLIHWLLAQLNSRTQKHLVTYFSLYLAVLQIALFVAWFFSYITLVPDLVQLSVSKSFFYALLLFLSTPFTYNIHNAKNLGLSIRFLGLLLGQLMLLLFFLFYQTNDLLYLILGGPLALIIILSSQFPLQMVLFGSIVIATITGNMYFLLPIIIGVISFYVFLPSFATHFLTAQLNHKYLYWKYNAKAQLLSIRRSIWLDFLWPIPKRLFKQLVRFDLKSYDWTYIKQNAVILLVFEMPVFLLFYYLFFYQNLQASEISKALFWVALILFVLFSFRQTRFLGEPERYLEFFLPLLSIAIVIHSESYTPIVLSILLSSAFLAINIHTLLTKPPHVIDTASLDLIQSKIQDFKDPYILCNAKIDMRYFQNTDIMHFFYRPTLREIDGLMYTDVFVNQNKYIAPKQFKGLLNHYSQVNFVLINKNNGDTSQFLRVLEESFHIILEHNQYLLLGKK